MKNHILIGIMVLTAALVPVTYAWANWGKCTATGCKCEGFRGSQSGYCTRSGCGHGPSIHVY